MNTAGYHQHSSSRRHCQTVTSARFLSFKESAHLSTVIGRREESDQLPLGKEFVSILHDLKYQLHFPGDVDQVLAHLVRSTNQVHIVLLQEPRNDIRAESERYTSVIL